MHFLLNRQNISGMYMYHSCAKCSRSKTPVTWQRTKTTLTIRSVLYLHTLLVDLYSHEQLSFQIHNSLVPVILGVSIQRGKHDGKNCYSIVAHQTHDILVVPVVKSSFRNLHTQNDTQREAFR